MLNLARLLPFPLILLLATGALAVPLLTGQAFGDQSQTIPIFGNPCPTVATGPFDDCLIVAGIDSLGTITIAPGPGSNGTEDVGGIFLGISNASHGVLDVTGPSANLTISGDSVGANVPALWVGGGFQVGPAQGTVNVTGGGKILMTPDLPLTPASQGPFVLVGGGNATGIVNVTGAGSELRLVSDQAMSPVSNITVGFGGAGTVNVLSGGLVSLSAGSAAPAGIAVGSTAPSVGAINVDGAGSRLETTGSAPHGVAIGVAGSATLDVTNQGHIETANLELAQQQGSSGTATVDAASTITLQGTAQTGTSLTVGYRGTGLLGLFGQLDLVSTAPAFGITLGGTPVLTPGGGTGVMNADGPNALVTMGPLGGMTIGSDGSGTLNIVRGATVNSPAGATVARDPGSSGTVNVDGAGSSWVTGGVRVGEFGIGTFNLTNGGQGSGTLGFGAGMNPGATGTITIDGSTLQAGLGVSIGKQLDGVTDGGTGLVTLMNGAVINGGGVIVGAGGTLNGVGTINGNVTNDGGTVAPGLSPGTLTVNGDFALQGGTLEIQVAGTGAGQFDVLDVTGTTDLTGGTVVVQFSQGYVPQNGEQVSFLNSGTTTGTPTVQIAGAQGTLFTVNTVGGVTTFTANEDFTALSDSDSDGVTDDLDNCTDVPNGPSAGPNDQLDRDLDGFGNVCDCDYDNSGFCAIADFTFFLADFTSASPSDSGRGTDQDGDGFVGISDFNLFLPGFVAGVPGPAAAP